MSPTGYAGSSRNEYWNTAATRGSEDHASSRRPSALADAASSPAVPARGLPGRGAPGARLGDPDAVARGTAAARVEGALERGHSVAFFGSRAGSVGLVGVDRPVPREAQHVGGQRLHELVDREPVGRAL